MDPEISQNGTAVGGEQSNARQQTPMEGKTAHQEQGVGKKMDTEDVKEQDEQHNKLLNGTLQLQDEGEKMESKEGTEGQQPHLEGQAGSQTEQELKRAQEQRKRITEAEIKVARAVSAYEAKKMMRRPHQGRSSNEPQGHSQARGRLRMPTTKETDSHQKQTDDKIVPTGRKDEKNQRRKAERARPQTTGKSEKELVEEVRDLMNLQHKEDEITDTSTTTQTKGERDQKKRSLKKTSKSATSAEHQERLHTNAGIVRIFEMRADGTVTDQFGNRAPTRPPSDPVTQEGVMVIPPQATVARKGI